MATPTTPSNTTPSSTIPLTQLTRGQSGRVQINGAATEEIKMLRAMGLRPNASITMCRLGEPCIISLSGACGGGCRIGLAKEIAGRVMVHVDVDGESHE
ncbi:MAG: ferrous iron transport protein A [Phycisphaerales bacterium]|nr:ferrous iron transport protein A [Phycisphaerales bacterium]